MSRSPRQQWITHDVKRTTGENARQANIDAGKAVAAALRSTLGPSGRDKMLIGVNGTVIVSNNGASILDRMDIADPTAHIIAQAASAQNKTIGDGVTTTVLYVGELLSKAEELLNEGLHPTTILKGYRRAVSYALQRLDDYRITVTPTDDELLQAVAKTVVTGRWDAEATDRLATLTTDAVRASERNNTSEAASISVTAYPGGELRDSALIAGIVVDMNASSTTVELPDAGYSSTVTDARIAVINDAIAINPPDSIDKTVISTSEQLNSLRSYESDTQTEIVHILDELAVDVLFCQKSVDDATRTKLAKNGILAIERTRQDEFDSLADATAATAVQSVSDLDNSDIGIAGSVEQRSVGSTRLLIVADLPNKQASLLLRGGTTHVAEETKRLIESCIAVVRSATRGKGVLPGGGATDIALSMDLAEYAKSIGSREQLAIRGVASSLEQIPRTLVSNVGRDPLEIIPQLRNSHIDSSMVGIDSSTGDVRDMLEADVLEPVTVKRQCLVTAMETTATILRINDILQYTGTDTDETSPNHDRPSRSQPQQSTTGYPWAVGH